VSDRYYPGDKWVDYPYRPDDQDDIEMPGGSNDNYTRGDNPPRTINESGTVIGRVIPVIYGKRKAEGQMIVAEPVNGQLYIAWSVCDGPVNWGNEEWINDDPIGDVTWFSSHSRFRGEVGQSPSPLLTGAIPGFVEAYPGLAYQVGQIAMADADIPGTLNFSAIVLGMYYRDFRDDTWDSHRNPITHVYNILLQHDPLSDTIQPDEVDEPSWKAAADWCDELMPDGTARWTYNRVIDERDPWICASEILKHCFCHIVWYNGKYYMYAERDDLPITGHIGVKDWVTPPVATENQLGNRPTEVRVRYISESDWTEHGVVSSEHGVDVRMVRREEITLNGCTNASMAYRWAEQYRLQRSKNVIVWDGEVGVVGATLFPGDVVTIDLPSGRRGQKCRVISIRELTTEKYGVILNQYETGTVSNATASDDIPVHGRGLLP